MIFKLNIQFKQVILLPIFLLSIKAFAQAPNIHYIGSSVLTPGTAYSISPSNSGGAVPATTYGQVTFFVSNIYGTPGYTNGSAADAKFNAPRQMTMDASGNLYLADKGNNAIRKITPSGVVSTFAGSPTGVAGYKDTTGFTSALFNGPVSVAIDASGNFFVSDYNNNAIRKITPAGVVSTFYSQANLDPYGICFDSSGNMVVTSQGLNQMLRISPSGVATVIAGSSWGYANGTGSAAQFGNPTDGRLDPSGNIIVADYYNNAIRKVTPAGQVTTLAGSTVSGNTGSFLDGVGTAARFKNPRSVAITQGGVIYVADYANQDIRRIMPDGTVTLIAGSPTQAQGRTDGVGTAATFFSPLCIYVDNTGIGYVVDEWSDVRKLVLTGYTLKGTLPTGLSFNPTTGMISGTPVGITKALTDTITAFNATGYSTAMITFTPAPPPNISYTGSTALTAGTAFSISPSNSGGAIPSTTYGQVTLFAGNSVGTPGNSNGSGSSASFHSPESMTADAAGNLYVGDGANNAIRKITPGGLVSTFAGSPTGASGYKDTTASAALFNDPVAVAIDASGNLFVGDYNNNAIRKITPAGLVSTFYSQANLTPAGVSFDSSGNLIVTAQTLRQILKISPTGTATVIAGSTYGYNNAAGTAAQFENPMDAQPDPAGNIIVADYLNNAIRKITPAGAVSTLAGSTVSGNTGTFLDGVGTAARFNNPTGVTIAQGGVIYVADFVNNDIRRIMPDGTVQLIAGSATQVHGYVDGTGTAAQFYSPMKMYIDASGTGYISEYGNNRIRKIALTGYTLKGTLPAGLTFNSTTGVISGTPTGTITTVTDTITAFNATGYSTTTVTMGPLPTISYGSSQNLTYAPGTPITTLTPTVTGNPVPYTGYTSTFIYGAYGSPDNTGISTSMYQPEGLAFDKKGNLYISDYDFSPVFNRIYKVTPQGALTTLAGGNNRGFVDGTGTGASFQYPLGLALDTAGNVYVADEGNNAIRKITSAGLVTTLAGGTMGSADGTGGSAQFFYPGGVALDASGNVFVADYSNNTIRKITSTGSVTTLAGGTQGFADGTGTGASFYRPSAVAIDGSGNLFVSDQLNHRIRKVTPGGAVTTIAGNGTAGFADGPAATSQFYYPAELAVDKLGNIYVSDSGNDRIRMITPGGTVSTLAGGNSAGFNNGVGSKAVFDYPWGMAIDASGTLFVGDDNGTVRKVVTTPYTISPALPAGLSFDPNTGIISGTPTSVTAATTYTVTAYNKIGATSTILTISVGTGTITPSQNQNYIITYAPRVSGKTTAAAVVASAGDKTQVQTNIQYFDGLGRPLQTVQVKGSPGGMDLVQPAAYDQFGRAAVKYLPYAATTDDGSYKTDALTPGAGLLNFYNPSGSTTLTQQSNGIVNTSYPYAVTGFEPSPLNRVVEQGAPGSDWQLPGTGDANSTGHTARTIYTFNNYIPSSDTTNSMLVMIYTATINSDQSRTLFNNNGATYLANLLSVTITRDENWKSGRGGTTEVYKDNQGRVILKRTFNYTGGTLQTLSTYYVYDDFGNLAFVLPPLSNPDSGTPSQTTLDNLCYQYRYDENGRLTQKKIPGKDWEYTVYNQLNQPVLTQDGNQRTNNQNQWTVTKYDALGRVIMTGLWNAGSNIALATLQASVYAGVQWDVRDYTNNTTGYNVSSYPALSKTLTVNYYDDYTNIPSVPPAYTTGPTGYSTMIKGLQTATKTAVLNTLDNASPDMLWAVNFYDELGRDIQTYKQHYLSAALSPYNYDLLTNTYNFTNQPLASLRQHYIKNSGNTAAVLAVTISNSYDYDHIGRKTNSWEQINTDTKILLAQNVYNEIGQLRIKKLHSENNGTSFLQVVNYNYNERGWLLSGLSSGNTFNFYLYYNLPDAGISKQYNGNIAEMLYTKTGAGNVTFQYAYDQLNRLNSAVSTGNTLNETISYDLNGNIMSLVRTGNNAASLSYSYYNSNQSNQLQTVTNSGAAFRSYSYDPNGNATSDGGSKTITYNLLDLPQTVTQSSTTLATYTYDAAGDKLRNTGSDGSWDYISGVVYNNNAISFIQTEEGRASLQGGAYHYEYNLKDNLGNVRYSFDKDPTTGNARRIQEDEYYSFGLRETPGVYDFSNNNRYLYNGKEIQTDLTSQYDYGARFYDPVIGRWNAVDPLAEKGRRWSPYTYVFNNPMRFADPDGMWGLDGTVTWISSDGYIETYDANTFARVSIIHPDASGKPVVTNQTSTSSTTSTSVGPGWLQKILSYFGINIKDPTSEDEASERAKGMERLSDLDTKNEQIQENVDEMFDDIPVLNGAYTIFKGLSEHKTGMAFAGVASGMFDAFGAPLVEDGAKRLAQLALKDGMHLPSGKILELAEKYLGKGYKELEPGSGRFISADGKRVFRIGDNDILGLHGGGPHVNFESLAPNPAKPGKMKVVTNLHIYIKP